jgi:hypothetical protein
MGAPPGRWTTRVSGGARAVLEGASSSFLWIWALGREGGAQGLAPGRMARAAWPSRATLAIQGLCLELKR